MNIDFRALLRRVQSVIVRGRVTRSEDVWRQVETAGGDVLEDLEHVGTYGFSSVPLDGSEAIVLCPGGARDGGFVIACEDRRYRLKGLKGGEVALFTDEGDSIVLRRGNRIEVTTKTYEVKANSFKVTTDDFSVETKACTIKGAQGELIETLSRALQSIATSTTATPAGPQPLVPAATDLIALKATLDGFGGSS